MERVVLVSTYETVTAAQETPTKAILAFIHASELVAGKTELIPEKVSKTIMPQQLIEGTLPKDEPFEKLCLITFSNWFDVSVQEHVLKWYSAVSFLAPVVWMEQKSPNLLRPVAQNQAEAGLEWLHLGAPRSHLPKHDLQFDLGFDSPVDHGHFS